MAAVFRNFRRFAVFFTSAKKPKNVKSICKVLVPCLSFQNMSTKAHTEQVNGNMVLKKPETPKKEETKNALVLILAWMQAKEKHMTKYSDFYLKNGFDVLTVRTHPKQLMLPTSGAQVVAENLLDYLLKNEQYQKIVLHAFSVGGYQMGEILLKMKQDRFAAIPDRFVAQIYDSMVDFYGIPKGLPTALTKNQVMRKVYEIMIRTYMVMFHTLSTKYHIRSSDTFHHNYLKCPALFFTSKTDTIGPTFASRKVADIWEGLGTDITFVTFEKSKHVQHMGTYPEQYCAELKKHLAKVKLCRL